MRFIILYCIYLIVSLFYPSVPNFGPISLRHILSVLMLSLCFAEGGLKLDRFLKWYLFFLLFHIINEAGSGYSSYIFPKIFGTYLASISLYLSTKVMIEKYEKGSLIIIILVALGIINSIEAIGQFFGSPIAQAIPQLLHIYLSEENLAILEKSDLHGYNVGGLMGAVLSGYFLAATSVLALYNKGNNISVLNWLFFSVIFLGLFLVQERSGLLAGILFSFLFYVTISIRNQRTIATSTLIIFIAIAVFVMYGSRYISVGEMRYSTVGMTDNRRVHIAAEAFEWLLHNPWGGANYYFNLGGHYPHNFFANALLYGGIIGGIVIIGILFVQMYKIAQIIFAYITRGTYSMLLLACCFAYLCYTLNSFFHNYSLVMGGEMIFLLWAMIDSLKYLEDNPSEDIDFEEEEDMPIIG